MHFSHLRNALRTISDGFRKKTRVKVVCTMQESMNFYRSTITMHFSMTKCTLKYLWATLYLWSNFHFSISFSGSRVNMRWWQKQRISVCDNINTATTSKAATMIRVKFKERVLALLLILGTFSFVSFAILMVIWYLPEKSQSSSYNAGNKVYNVYKKMEQPMPSFRVPATPYGITKCLHCVTLLYIVITNHKCM